MPLSRLNSGERQLAIRSGIIQLPSEDRAGSYETESAVPDKISKRLDLGKKGVMDLPDSKRGYNLGNRYGNQYPAL